MPGAVNDEVAGVFRSIRTLQRALERREKAESEVTQKRPRVDLSSASSGVFVHFRSLQQAAEPAKSSEETKKKKKKVGEDAFFEEDFEEEEDLVEEEEEEEEEVEVEEEEEESSKNVAPVVPPTNKFHRAARQLYLDGELPFAICKLCNKPRGPLNRQWYATQDYTKAFKAKLFVCSMLPDVTCDTGLTDQAQTFHNRVQNDEK